MNNDHKLEDFIHNHRDELEESPNEDKLWNAIESNLNDDVSEVSPSEGQRDDYSIYWKVAAILLLVLSSVLGYFNWQNAEPTAEMFNPEFVSAETYYNGLIDQKKEEIRVYTIANQELESSFLQDVEILDTMYDELKLQAKNSGGQEIVVNAMIQNLQLRIDILNQQIKVLEQIKNKEGNANATI